MIPLLFFIGQSSGIVVAPGDLIYRDVSTWRRLAGNTTASQLFLSQTGDGANSAAPVWASVPASSGASYVPVTTGAEPVALVSDGAGVLILTPYTP